MRQSVPGQFALGELAETVDGQIQGDPDQIIQGVGTLETAGPQQISFVSHNRFRRAAESSQAGALLVTDQMAAHLTDTPCIIVTDPYRAYARVSQLFWRPDFVAPGIHPTAIIDPAAELGEAVRIGPGAVVEAGVSIGDQAEVAAGCYLGEGVVLGRRTHLRPRVTLYPDVVVGEDCILHAGVVIGADGFGFAPAGQGWEKIAQLGRVVIGDRVEIGANTTIDRGALDDTVIESDVILDNLVQIGHNARLGSGSAMAGQSGLAGSAIVGKRVMVGGQTGVGGHITIADNVQFMGQSMVNKSITEPGAYGSGIPVQPAAEWRKMVARLKQLGTLAEKVSTLWKKANPTKD